MHRQADCPGWDLTRTGDGSRTQCGVVSSVAIAVAGEIAHSGLLFVVVKR